MESLYLSSRIMTLLQYYLSGSAEQSDYQEVGMEYLFDKAISNIRMDNLGIGTRYFPDQLKCSRIF